mmetsp:Transcript_170236/g.545956  ORF Transcript_170236/g.545956 Transcript_170236/m.545956 type:complete len:731 (-) Transcript_170236:251-2443(-)
MRGASSPGSPRPLGCPSVGGSPCLARLGLPLGLPPGRLAAALRASPRSARSSLPSGRSSGKGGGSAAADEADALNNGVLLHQAVHGNEQYLIVTAIDRGVSVDFFLEDEPNKAMRTPLRAACALGNMEVVRMLLARGAKVFAGFEADSWTALHSAAQAGHERVMKQLLWESDELHEGAVLDGFSLSHVMMECLSSSLVNNEGADVFTWMLTKRPGLDLDIPSARSGYYDWTPLHMACARGCAKAASCLLQLGATGNVRTGDFYIGSYEIYEFAAAGLRNGPQVAGYGLGFDRIGVQWLDKGLLPIHLAALGGHLHALSFMVKRGQSINATTTRHRWTPLMFAIWSGKESLVREICRMGGREVVNEVDRRGDGSEWTPLALAVVRSTPGTVQALIEYGADPLVRLCSADFPGRLFVKLCPAPRDDVIDQWSGPDHRISLIHLAVTRGDAAMLRKVVSIVRAAHQNRACHKELRSSGTTTVYRSGGTPRSSCSGSGRGQHQSPRSCTVEHYTPVVEGGEYHPETFTTAEGWSPAMLAIMLQGVDPGRHVRGAAEFLQAFPEPLGGSGSRADVFLELLATGHALLEDRLTVSPPVLPQRFADASEPVVVAAIDEFVRLCKLGNAERVAYRILHTTLCVACRFDRYDVVKHLLESGLCDPCCRFLRPVECRPLHVATACGFGDLVQLLLAFKADPLECDESADFPINKLTRFYEEQIATLQAQLCDAEARAVPY